MADQFKMVRAAPVLWVRDMDAMIEFYVERLGFADVWKQGDQTSPDYAIVSTDGVEIHLSPQKPQFAGHSYFHVLMVNIEPYWALVSSRDVEIVKPIGDRDYQMRDFMVRDVEGNLIEFGQNL